MIFMLSKVIYHRIQCKRYSGKAMMFQYRYLTVGKQFRPTFSKDGYVEHYAELNSTYLYHATKLHQAVCVHVWNKTGTSRMASRTMNTCKRCSIIEAGPD